MIHALFGSPLPVGSEAPDFRLSDQAGKVHELSQLRGSNVVLIFYPRDETPVCRTQLCDFRDRVALSNASNTKVFGVNPQNASSHAKFQQRHGFPFPLLIDQGGSVAAIYHAGIGPIVRRTVYLIGKSGTIRYAMRGNPPAETVLAAAEP